MIIPSLVFPSASYCVQVNAAMPPPQPVSQPATSTFTRRSLLGSENSADYVQGTVAEVQQEINIVL